MNYWKKFGAKMSIKFDYASGDVVKINILLLPIRLTILYLFFTLIVYIVCPFNWITYRPFLFYGLLGLYGLALWFGYRKGIKWRSPVAVEWKEDMTHRLIHIVSPLIVVNCVIYLLNIFRDYCMESLNFVELWHQMYIGIMNPGLGYSLRYERQMTYQGGDIWGGYVMTFVNYVWDFVGIPIVLLSMLYFRRLKLWAKVCTVLYLILVGVHYLSIGTIIRIFHIFLIVEIPAIVHILQCTYRGEFNWRKGCRFIVHILIGIAFIICYFTWMMVSRGGINRYNDSSYNVGGIVLKQNINSVEVTVSEKETNPLIVIPSTQEASEESQENSKEASVSEAEVVSLVQEDSEELREYPVEVMVGKIENVPPIIMKFWISFSSYLTQGYYGMSLALTESWTPMFGVGNSMFLVNFISEHITDIDSYTYSRKIEHYGWDSDVQWASMYTWLANDVSFYGVIIVMGLIGFLFAGVYRDAVVTENPFAKALLFHFIIMILFIPCNNQLAQGSSTLFSFVSLMACWLYSRCAMKRKGKPGSQEQVVA